MRFLKDFQEFQRDCTQLPLIVTRSVILIVTRSVILIVTRSVILIVTRSVSEGRNFCPRLRFGYDVMCRY